MVSLLSLLPALAGDRVTVGPGLYRPLYPVPGQESLPVAAFELDVLPVTREQYAAFVAAHPEWRRDRVSRLFADESYLGSWPSQDGIGALEPRAPITEVSWFAARAYCRSVGGRLPMEAEWELAASGSASGRASEETLAEILRWYSRPTPDPLPPVGGAPNGWGVSDLHGLVWEWVEDFNASLVSVDNREQGGADRAAFCGAGALSAADRDDYAAFMRTALRSSLSAASTTRNLGFRCAYDRAEE